MAAPTKFSFSVRSILDLPERDVEAAPRSSALFSCSSSSPYTAWMECDRSPCICEYSAHFITIMFTVFIYNCGKEITIKNNQYIIALK